MTTKRTTKRRPQPKPAKPPVQNEPAKQPNISGSEVPNCGPVHVAIPSFSYEKMNAVACLARSVEQLAKVLNEADVTVQVSNMHIVVSPDFEGPVVDIRPQH